MNPTGPATPPWLTNLNQWFEHAVSSVINTLGNAGQNLLQKAPPTIGGPGRNAAVNASRSFWDLIGKGIQQPTPTGAPKVNPMLVPSTWRPPAPPIPKSVAPPRAPGLQRPPTRKPLTSGTNVGSRASNPRPTYRPRSGGY